jgi:hypothetical protein
MPEGRVPIPAQHMIIQSIQGHLEYHAFWYLQRYFPPESLQNGWTCPEALGLHKLFQFLNRHRRRPQAETSGPAVSDIQGWRHSISAIRHAAVHRLAQNRRSLLQMTQAAIGFVHCISGPLHKNPSASLAFPASFASKANLTPSHQGNGAYPGALDQAIDSGFKLPIPCTAACTAGTYPNGPTTGRGRLLKRNPVVLRSENCMRCDTTLMILHTIFRNYFFDLFGLTPKSSLVMFTPSIHCLG